MAVAQFAEHVAEHLEQLLLCHVAIDLYLVFVVDLLPVEPVLVLFVVEEAVVLVDNPPQRLEVALRRVGKLLFVDTSRQPRQSHEPYEHK